jgi:fatty acid desaturase
MRARVAAPNGVVLADGDLLPRIEWPTLALAATIYGGWLALTFWHAALPWWVAYPALAWLVAWHASLQHEVLHGHPTRSRRINDALGFVPLELWLPYHIYRVSHLRHHDDVRLTDPLDDPESRYWLPEQWGLLSRPGRLLFLAQNTFLGRLLLGPVWIIGRFFYFQSRALAQGHPGSRRVWVPHLLGVAAVLAWVWGVCGMHPLLYVIGVVYPAASLMLIRSFAEHRAAEGVRERIAIVENAPVLGLLFLYNNLHLVHHAWPEMPWWRIPRVYRAHRDRMVAANGGLVYDGYRDVARRFWLTPHDKVLHPHGRAPTPVPPKTGEMAVS